MGRDLAPRCGSGDLCIVILVARGSPEGDAPRMERTVRRAPPSHQRYACGRSRVTRSLPDWSIHSDFTVTCS